MELTGVLISTSVTDYPAMRSFYVETLGLSPRSDRLGFVNFDFGHCRLTIAVHDRVHGSAAEPERIMVNLAVPDAAEIVGRLPESVVVRPPEREKWGGIVATVRDPGGNLIQFLQME